ncbi:ribosomal protein S25 [Pullulanibacillus pueri]|uniref:Rv2525c-like glycoside hydrolase-like domain-containing protein n=1 Tax=Pullulanibacillus pueri TaxID=1437324 RepID=A0A8J2ZUN8_9BACL|nr:glycoside hydrolase domain-containing protein [Pullulanibacillus pueri]MBM7681408.1 ribosomal protein S25 [Pullulanibacillus pueri]GGH78758.1 hypothetical protein GCM10007096_12670 [Pullulanibacillus pueri]
MNKHWKKMWEFFLAFFLPVLLIVVTLVALTLNQMNETTHKSSPNTEHNSDNQKEHKDDKKDNGHKKGDSQKDHKTDVSKLQWGIDTAKTINKSAYQCIEKNFGKPQIAGRYLVGKEGINAGLTKEEVKLLHDKGVKVLPIYNNFTNATGKDRGQSIAKEAIKAAKEIGVKKGTFIVADIEPKTPVDADFLIAWTKTIKDSNYKAAIYGDLEDDNLKDVYKKASNNSDAVQQHLMLWTNGPNIGITGKEKAPDKFNGASPNKDHTYAWQYGIESKQCNIDTDLFTGQVLEFVW